MTSNSATSACSLPVELLISIFRFLVPDDEEDDLGHSNRDYRWFMFSHVCQYWRQASLSAPTLWSTIHLQHQEDLNFLPTTLERSRDALLRIRVVFPTLPETEEQLYATFDELATELVTTQIGRISCLKVSGIWPTSGIINRLVEPAPFLESLDIADSQYWANCRTPLLLLGGSALRLRRLVLRMPLSHYEHIPDLVGSLTFLHLHAFTPDSMIADTRPSSSIILAIIRAATRLEVLRLLSYRLRERYLPLNQSGLSVIRLSRLKSLFLRGSSLILRFLGYLVFPSDTSMEVLINNYRHDTSPQTSFVHLTPLISPPDPPILSLLVDQHEDNLNRVVAAVHPCQHHDLTPRIPPSHTPRRLDIIAVNHPQIILDIIRNLYPSLLHLQSLHLELKVRFINLYDSILHQFSSCATLRSLSINGNQAHFIMIPLLGRPHTAADGAMPFPALRTLELRNWKETWTTDLIFEEDPDRVTTAGGETFVPETHILLDALLSMLRFRGGSECGLQEIVFVDSEVPEDAIRAIGEVVGTVKSVPSS